MNLKRLFVMAGVVALIGVLWASPAAADNHTHFITLDPTSVPAELGDVEIAVSGGNWSEPVPFFITACTGAGGDVEPVLAMRDLPTAQGLCPNLLTDVRAVEWDDGSFATTITVTITQAEIDAGALVIGAGWLDLTALADPESNGALAVLTIGEPMEEETMEEEMMEDADASEPGGADEEPMEEEMMEDADASEPGGADEEMMDADEESMDDETMDEGATEGSAPEEGSVDDLTEASGEEEMPVTGSDSNLIVIMGAAILVAGLLVLGTGRRVRTVNR